MATYQQVKNIIIAALTGRTAGTKVAVANHEAAEIALLDYIEQKAAGFTSGTKNSPYGGTANQILANAIINMTVDSLEKRVWLVLAYVKAGIFNGTKYVYEVCIMQMNADMMDDMQSASPAMKYTYLANAPLTGTKDILLSEDDGSGRFGRMVINWSALPVGALYESQSYTEGCLFATVPTTAGTPGNTTEAPVIFENTENVQGVNGVILLNIASETPGIHIVNSKDMERPIRLKNLGSEVTVNVHAEDELQLDGAHTSIILGQYKYIEIHTNGSSLFVIGDYTV